MKRIMLMLLAAAFITSIAYAEFDGFAGPSDQKAFDGKWDESKYIEDCHEHPGPCMDPCTEICPGYKPHGHDECGCNHGCEKQCDCGKKTHNSDNCFVFEKCDECGKTVCDGTCSDCGKRCDVYEYCSKCNTRYSVCHADGICDRCGRDCYCIEKCQKCGHNQYFNGYCDECASRCDYTRCCFNYLVDAKPWMDDGYPEVDGINPGAQDAYEDHMLFIIPPEDAPIDEAPVGEAPVDEAPVDEAPGDDIQAL